jgi:hypothetical protein
MRSFETQLAAALHNVPVPEGLGERLTARLQQTAAPAAQNGEAPLLSTVAAAASAETISASSTPAEAQPVHLAPPRPMSRRRLLVAAGSLAAGLLVMAGAWRLINSSDDSQADPAALAGAWGARLTAVWQPSKSLPAGFALPQTILAAPTGWQAIGKKVVGPSGVAINLSQPGAVRAVLYVVRMTLPQLPAAPPGSPQSATGGRTVAAWQNAGLVYVLVVEGDERVYRRFINTTAAPLA